MNRYKFHIILDCISATLFFISGFLYHLPFNIVVAFFHIFALNKDIANYRKEKEEQEE